MRQKGWFSVLKNLSFLTQVGVSIAAPIVLCLLLANWLVMRCGWGTWVFVVAAVLGIGGGVSAFWQFAGVVRRQSRRNHKR